MINTSHKTNELILISLLLAFTTPAYSEENAQLELKFERTVKQDPKNAFPTLDIGCEIIINKPIDNRFNTDNLGVNFFDEPVVSNQPTTEWLESALLSLNTTGIHVSNTQELGKSNNLQLSTKMNRLYVWNHGMRLYATIALEAKLSNVTTGKEFIKNYRVSGSKINWWGADSEYATTLNISANRLIEQIATDIADQCGQLKPI